MDSRARLQRRGASAVGTANKFILIGPWDWLSAHSGSVSGL